MSQVQPPYQSQPSVPPFDPTTSKRVLCGVMGIVLGALGIHKFVLGYTGTGLIMLLVSLLTCGIGASVMGVIGLIEGIMYLTKTEEQFYQEYVVNKKQWF